MEVLQFGSPNSRRVLIQPVDRYDLEGMDRQLEAIKKAAGEDFCLLALKIQSWNHELSPWPAPPAFGKEAFGGGAGETLERVLALCRDPERRYCLGGYSLAGLFALWAAGRTDRFAGVAAASPSVWFPGFVEDLTVHPPKTRRVYLSLGDREARTRNPMMAPVGDNIRTIAAWLPAQGIETTLEWNRGGHFQDPDLRTARAFAWTLGQLGIEN